MILFQCIFRSQISDPFNPFVYLGLTGNDIKNLCELIHLYIWILGKVLRDPCIPFVCSDLRNLCDPFVLHVWMDGWTGE